MPIAMAELPKLEAALNNLTVGDLKWYASALANSLPTRKGELVGVLLQLLQPARLRQLWGQLSPERQHLVSEVVHNLGGRYNAEMLHAKYPNVPAPQPPSGGTSSSHFEGESNFASAGAQAIASGVLVFTTTATLRGASGAGRPRSARGRTTSSRVVFGSERSIAPRTR